MRNWDNMAMGQNLWLYFSGDWDVQWGYGLLTHGHTELKMSELDPGNLCLQ